MFMTLDLNHVNLNEDPFEVCRRHASMIRHIHISDNHGIREEHLPPGEGVIPLAEIVRTLRENGFALPQGCILHDMREICNPFRFCYMFLSISFVIASPSFCFAGPSLV